MTSSSIPTLAPISTSPWALPDTGLSVYYGRSETPRLFHYFLPRAILEGKSRSCVWNGGNRFDPLLIARFFAREARIELIRSSVKRFASLGPSLVFQLTELLVRLPRLLRTFPAQLVIVNRAFPELAHTSPMKTCANVESNGIVSNGLSVTLQAERLSAPVAVFTDATSHFGHPGV